jgi:hypothetical protein
MGRAASEQSDGMVGTAGRGGCFIRGGGRSAEGTGGRRDLRASGVENMMPSFGGGWLWHQGDTRGCLTTDRQDSSLAQRQYSGDVLRLLEYVQRPLTRLVFITASKLLKS